jgi:hypothetical protein
MLRVNGVAVAIGKRHTRSRVIDCPQEREPSAALRSNLHCATAHRKTGLRRTTGKHSTNSPQILEKRRRIDGVVQRLRLS